LKTACGRCGGANTPDMAYCQFCGARLDAAGPAKARNAGVGPANAPGAQPPPWLDPARGERGADGRRAAAAADVSARLVVIAQDGTPGREYVLSGEQTDVGREEGNILLPNDPYVSPRHARVSRKNSAFFVRDLGSVNGVYVRLRRPMKLEHADLVLIGLEVLRFEVVSDAEKGLGPAAERGAHVFGSPAAPRFARLCQRTVEGVTRDVFYLTRDDTIIGRESGDIVFTSDPFMSRRHVSIARDTRDGHFTLRDLGSSNGTYLAIRGEIELENADHVRIGQHLFRLDVDPGGQN
jgi:pSer/pThr/pTyr-binding forkhead associated (FHA) protein